MYCLFRAGWAGWAAHLMGCCFLLGWLFCWAELELTSCLASHRDQKVVVSRCKIPVELDGLPNVTDS